MIASRTRLLCDTNHSSALGSSSHSSNSFGLQPVETGCRGGGRGVGGGGGGGGGLGGGGMIASRTKHCTPAC